MSQSNFKVIFGREAARFLGQGVYPSGADLSTIRDALWHMFGWEFTDEWGFAESEYKISPKKVAPDDGTVSTIIYMTERGIGKLGQEFRRIHQPAVPSPRQYAMPPALQDRRWAAPSVEFTLPSAEFMLQSLIQRHYDRGVWAARRECAGQVRVELLPYSIFRLAQ